MYSRPTFTIWRTKGLCSTIRYDTVDLRALKSWRDGQLNLAHGPETKNNEKIKIKNRVAQKKPSSCRYSFIFFLTVPSETDYLITYFTDLRHIFSIGSYMWMDIINLTFFSRSSRNVTDFGENRQKLAYPSSFCALAFHNGWKDRKRMRTLTPSMTALRLIKIKWTLVQ